MADDLRPEERHVINLMRQIESRNYGKIEMTCDDKVWRIGGGPQHVFKRGA